MTGRLASIAVYAVLALGASSAFAQQATDYIISKPTVGSKFETPPANGVTTLTVAPLADDGVAAVSLPFTFNYFHVNYTSLTACTNGFLTFGVSTYPWANGGFPLANTNYTNQSLNGAVCAYWSDLVAGPQYTAVNQGVIKTWTTGTAPNRHFVVHWDSIYDFGTTGSDGAGPMTFQIQLYELGGSIVISYGSAANTFPTSGTSPGYTVGIQSLTGSYEYPDNWTNDGTTSTGRPPTDYVFDYPPLTFAGRIVYDRYVVDESGIGNSSQQNVPLANFVVQALDGAGGVVGTATTDADGVFSLVSHGVPVSTVGSLAVVSQTTACIVHGSTGAPAYSTTLKTSVSYSGDRDFGTIVLHEGVDAGGVGRAPLNIARSIQTVYDWATARSSATITPLDVLYSTASSLPTTYAPASATPASMRVGGASSNPDQWDASVIRKTYARHVINAITAPPSTAYDQGFDVATDDQNAFAEGFAYYLNAAVSGDRKYYDGINSTTTNVIDLEDASPTATKGANVAAWVAEALYDLTDPANETWDTFAGAGTAGEQAFRTVDSLTSAATASKFYNAWIVLGYDVPSLTVDFVHHGVLADDPDEPNDEFATATSIASIGFLKEHRVLNLFNEDWYQFTLPQSVPSLIASVVYDRGKYASSVVELQLRSSGNSVIAVGQSADPSAPIKLTTAALPAGVYRLRISLTSGVPVADYVVQAFKPLTFTSAAFQPWTVGKQYDVPLTISGGIPPYILTVPTNSVAPAGLVLDGTNARVTGIPTGPTGGVPVYGAYSYSFGLIAQDSARPSNQVQGQQSFTLNDVVRSRFVEFVVFAKDKPVDRAWPPVGGTAPYSVAVDEGALPSGVDAVGGASLRFVGTPDASGHSPFKITATDVSGSTATALASGVVCVPVGPLELAAGKTAGGFWFDAVKDASVGFTVSTAKKKLIRTLRLAMYDVDGFRTLPITPKYGKGKASFTKFIAPSSGRFYCVVASDDALDATTLGCVAKSAPPTKGKGDAGTFSFGGADTLELPVGLLNGGTMTFTVKPDKTSGLRMKVAALKNPAGQSVTLGATDVKVVAKSGLLTLTHKVDVSGTWTVVLGAETGPRGTFTYAYKLKQPKGVVYLAD